MLTSGLAYKNSFHVAFMLSTVSINCSSLSATAFFEDSHMFIYTLNVYLDIDKVFLFFC